jgi:membrane protein DedA with SNARE-associated domain
LVQFTDLILSNIALYGPWIMGLGLMISAAGLPIPISPIVVAAGAAVQMYGFQEFDLFLWGFLGVALGDSLCYLAGRLAMEPIQRLTPNKFQPMWHKVHSWINRSGGTAVFFSRWLMHSVDVPLSMAAGGSRFPFKSFAQNILLGRMLWFAIYGGLGFAVGAQWQQFSTDMGAYQGWIAGIVLVIIMFYALLNYLRTKLIPQMPEA